MADGTIDLPSRQSRIEPNEAGMASDLGPAQQARPNWLDVIKGSGDPDVIIDVVEEADGTISEIGSDGSVTIGIPAIHTHRDDEDAQFGENIADRIEGALPGIAEEIIEGVEADSASRSPWTDQYQKAIDLLGLKIEDLNSQSRGRSRDVSRANHTLLIEAMVKYHAGAEGELLPASGPCKVTTIGRQPDTEEERAKDFQDTFNYFLTDVAKEYYPDTSRMLMHQAFCGQGYKKVFFCPIRNRPVSESINAPDLIISEQATDLDNALRVTHEIEMIEADIYRMHIAGHYREIELPQPTGNYGIGGSAQRKIKESEGLVVAGSRPQDQPYLILESDAYLSTAYHDINLKFERKAPEGMPLPYKIAVDRTSHQVLGVWRNWKPDDIFFRKHNMYVKFGLVPGLGFHDWGFMQLLGNQTRNLRSMLRLLITAGMFGNFPGGMKLKGARTSTNEISPGPGEWVDIDVNMGPGVDINKLVAPMPYKGPDNVFVQLMELVKQDAMRLGGTVELQVGEGNTQVPVGTVLAMVEQQTQVMAGVHKRNHRSQREELRKLRELFIDNPGILWKLTRERPRSDPSAVAHQWQTASEMEDLNLQPASDPNVPSQAHRVMLANVLVMLAGQFGDKLDVNEILRTAVKSIGADPDRYVIRPGEQQPPPPDPRAVAAQMKAQQQQMDTAARGQEKMAELEVEKQKISASLAQSSQDNEARRAVEGLKQTGELAKAKIQAGAQLAQSDKSEGSET
jgi:hypothetical protein